MNDKKVVYCIMKTRRLGLLLLTASLCLALFAGCGKTAPVVMVVNGEEVYADEFAYYMRVFRDSFSSSFGEAIWETDSAETLGDYAKQQAREQAIIRVALMQAADEMGLGITAEDRETLKQNKRNIILNAGGTAAYEKALKDAGMTDRLNDLASEFSFQYEKVYQHFYGEGGVDALSESELRAYFEENYISAAHILQKTVDDAYAPLSEDVIAEKRAKTEELLAQIEDGADLLALSLQYSEDTGGVASAPKGYTFTKGDMVDVFYQAALALEPGEVSGVVESEYGYHIILRQPLDYSYLEENAEAVMEKCYDTEFSAYLGGLIADAETDTSAAYDDITISNFTQYLSK